MPAAGEIIYRSATTGPVPGRPGRGVSCNLGVEKRHRSFIMANGAERVHRLTGDTFHRLRNDHEQFLEAYESEWSFGRWGVAVAMLGIQRLTVF